MNNPTTPREWAITALAIAGTILLAVYIEFVHTALCGLVCVMQ